MVTIAVTVPNLKKTVGVKKLGNYPACGMTYCGRLIASITFTRYNIVEYHMTDGREGPKFQDVAYIDD